MSAPNPFRPSQRMLRQFSAIWIVFFGSFALWQGLVSHRHVLAIGLGLLSVTIGPLGLALPRFMKPIFIAWMTIAYPIGWVMSHIILAAVFYALFTPLALAFRLFGRDVLALKRNYHASTYWVPKPAAIDKAQYLHQS